MLLFEGKFGNILHTGDCRLTPECLLSLPDKYIGKRRKEPRCRLDYVFLDCTFGQYPLKMPSRHTAIRQVIDCIWKHPDATMVYLTCDLLGQEEILVEVSQTFGEKIYVDKARNLECFRSLELIIPQILSQDSSSRFQLFNGFPKLYERAEEKIAEARASFQHEPLIIRPSSQWYVCNEGVSEVEKQRKGRVDQAVRDLYGLWHVCYSIHSSREELEWALQLVAPKWVVSTTPGCRAVELDYVKKHCFKNQQACNDSLWKLLDISEVASSVPDESGKILSCSHVDISNSCTGTQSEPVVISTHHRKRLSLSPPSKRPMFTLFGHARLGLPYFVQHEHKEVVTSCDSMEKAPIETENEAPIELGDGCFPKDGTEMKFEELLRTKRKNDFAETNCNETHNDDVIEDVSFQKDVTEVKYEEISRTKGMNDFDKTNCTETHKLATISPNCYNENLRRLYRSMNVPVPQRLPSLVKLIDAKKYAKKRT